MAINLPIVSTFDGKGVTGAISGIQNLGAKLLGLGAIVAGAFAVRAIVDFGRESIEAAQAVEVANNRLRAVAEATQVFGERTNQVTAGLIKFAESQEMVIGKDAEMIKGVQAVLLSFKSLSSSAGQAGGSFERATKLAFDMAAVLGGDASSQAMALAKALEDPEKGLTALRRAGTLFTEQQTEQVRAMVASGDLLGAQKLILDEVTSQYGGAAEATATFSEKLTLAFDNVKEAAGKALLPVFERFAQYLINDVIPPITKFFEEDFPPLLTRFEEAWNNLQPIFGEIGDSIKNMFNIPDDQGLLQGLLDRIAALEANPEFQEFLDGVVQAFKDWWPEMEKLMPDLMDLATELLPLLLQLVILLGPTILQLAILFSRLAIGVHEVATEMGILGVDGPKWGKILFTVVAPYLSGLIGLFDELADAIKRAWEWWTKLTNAGGGGLSNVNRFQGLSGGRAMGGPVTSGSMYAVGERGPELFIPSQNGTIIPNNAMGGSVYNITVNAGMGSDPVRVGEYVVSAIKRYERASGKVFASA